MPESVGTVGRSLRRVSLAQVAQSAGVSPAQASDALNGRGRVSAATVERVRAAAAQLGYVGNPHARRLRAQRTGIIGVHAAWSLHAPSPAEESMALLFAIVRAASARGYDTIVVTTPEDDARPLPDVDGMILLDPSPRVEFTSRILASDIPTVTSEFTIDGSRPDGTIFGNHRDAIRSLLDHVSGRGADAIAMFLPTVDNDWSQQRAEAYRAGCTARDVPERSKAMSSTWTEAEGRRALDELQGEFPEVDALISGPIGAGVYAADLLAAQGRSIGGDFLIAECDDGPELRLHDPAITALDWHPAETGAACAELLIDLLDSPTVSEVVHAVPIDLLVRPSTLGNQG